MDGMTSRGQLVVLAATNRANAMDPALRRPGRFDREIFVGHPGEVQRREILQLLLRDMPYACEVDVKQLARQTNGYFARHIY